MGNNIPEGQRFSLVYLKENELLSDSQKFRNRIFGRIEKYAVQLDRGTRQSFVYLLSSVIKEEIGIDIPSDGWLIYIEKIFKNNPIENILDIITFVWRILKTHYQYVQNVENDWLSFVRRVITEESLGYRVDDKCGVHLFVDEIFEINRSCALLSLENSRYSGVRDHFEKSYDKLNGSSDVLGAIKEIFSSLETLFKLITNNKPPSLSGKEVENHLTPLLEKVYKNQDDRTGAKRQKDVFKQWADANHYYRHGQGLEHLRKPPLEVAITIISTGTSYIRWLVEIDKKINRKN